MIVLTFEDTPEMRAALRQLAAHGVEDEAPIFEDPGDGKLPQPKQAEAFMTFDEEVNKALLEDL